MDKIKKTSQYRSMRSNNLTLTLIESAVAILILTMLASILFPKLIDLSGAG
jgi:hypothetical protein